MLLCLWIFWGHSPRRNQENFLTEIHSGKVLPWEYWDCQEGECNKCGFKGCLATLPNYPVFLRPFSAFFGTFPEGLRSTWEIEKKTQGKDLFPQISSDFKLLDPHPLNGLPPLSGTPTFWHSWVRNRAGESRPSYIRPNHFVYTCVGTRVSTHVGAFVWDYNTEKANCCGALSCTLAWALAWALAGASSWEHWWVIFRFRQLCASLNSKIFGSISVCTGATLRLLSFLSDNKN